MTLTSLLRELLRRALRDPAGVVGGVVRRWRNDPVWVLVKLDEVLPAGARRRLHRRAARSSGRGGALRSVLVVLAAVSAGDDAGVRHHLAARRGGASRRERVMVGRLLVHRERPEVALEWLDGHDDAESLGVRGAALARSGHWREAVAAFEAAVAHGGGPLVRTDLAKARSTVDGLAPSWTPVAPRIPPFAPRPNRVLHLLNNSLPQVQAGYTVRTQRVALAQRANGLDPVMVTRPGFPWNGGHFAASDEDVVDGISYHHVRDDIAGQRGVADLVAHGVEVLTPLVERLRPAALQPTSPHVNAQVALALGDGAGIPVVYELRGFLEETWLSRRAPEGVESDHYQWTRSLEAACAARADHVVTLGQAMRDDLVARGVPADRITVVPNAVDVDRFRPVGRGGAVRSELGFGSATVIGYVGSLVPYEGLEVMLGAVRELRDRGIKDVRCLVVGDGSARAHLEATVRTLGIGDAVTFVGRVPHDRVNDYYEAIDVFIVPRRDERVCRLVTPLKPVEAMAMARCVVVSALPALEELVVEGTTGHVFPAGDAPALAAVLEPLLLHPERRHEVGRAAREWVVDERTWDQVGRRYRAVYDALGLEVRNVS